MRLGNLLLDMDDVLFDTTIWHRWLYQLLGRLGIHSRFEALFDVWQSDYLPDVYLGRADYWDRQRTFLSAIGLSRGQIEEAVTAARGKQRWFETSLRPFPGVVSTLNQIKCCGTKIGVVCNSYRNAGELEHLLSRFQLNAAIDTIITSREHKICLPDPRLIECGMQALRCQPSETVFVSHDLQSLESAGSIGVLPVGFNTGPSLTGNDRFLTLERFAELPEIDFEQRPVLLAG